MIICLGQEVNNDCLNLEATRTFRYVNMQRENPDEVPNTGKERKIKSIEQKGLVAPGMVIALVVDHPDSNYYLLKAT